MPSLPAPRIQRLRRALVRRDAVDRAGRMVLVGGFALGAAALVGRVAFGLDPARAGLFFAPLAGAPLVALGQARRRILSEAAAAARLDAQTGGAGGVVTALEVPDPRWSARFAAQLAAAPEPPGPDLAGAARRVGVAVAFALAVLLVPVRGLAAPSGPPPGIFEPALERAQEKLAALEEVVTFPPEVQAELEEALERLEQEAARSQDPEATFEALARLEERLEQEAVEALDAAQRAAEALSAAATRAAEGAAPEAALQEALDALAASSLDLGALAEALPEGLDLGALGLDLAQGDLTLPEGVALDPALAGALSEELLELLEARLAELAAAGLLDADALAKLAHAAAQGEAGEPLTEAELAALEALEECPLCKDLPPGAT